MVIFQSILRILSVYLREYLKQSLGLFFYLKNNSSVEIQNITCYSAFMICLV